ncbi:MAG: SUMF1/EgtB/PvdO family nonheme iron enzyme [Xenococcus sp. (in: cyanobacteria)]
MSKKSDIQIFLAHAHEDKEVVFELYDRLKKAGYRPWLDKRDLIPGQNWRSEISRVIRESQLFIACLSKRSIAKQGFVQKEFRMALNQAAELPSKSIYIIPLRLDECEIPDLRQEEYGLNLRDIQWLDYWEYDGFAKLEKAINRQYGSFTQDQYSTKGTGLVEESSESLEKVELQKSQFQSFAEDLGNGIKLDMIAIPGGTFLMGSTSGRGEELPQHEVKVQPFFMGKYPVTQAQYKKVMSENPSYFEFDGDDRPVERVSWVNAVEFCKELSKKTGKEYRLPTEAEWEYACRVGTTTKYHCGNNIMKQEANYDGRQTTKVGKYPPNNFYLFDMHGNVWEWCQDEWHGNYRGAPNDGKAWISGRNSATRVMRGGSWRNDSSFCRSAYRNNLDHEYGYSSDIGFRVVCEAQINLIGNYCVRDFQKINNSKSMQ